ncbi:hypothetical protein [Neomegalonema sp.]|uniref:hypothetical protein n=1 Tax=Neomegalonema sp. TaxID=2039713 RepID=UPI002612EED8|nr:hypothetical protein [Neomegalonema sp.]MDD2870243.1 hypothetical protein [Neomegalonema sp.]
MPQMIAAAIVTAAGITGTAAAIATAVLSTAISLAGTMALNKLMTPDAPRPSDGQRNIRQGATPYMVHVGRMRAGGAIAFYESSDGTLRVLVVTGRGACDGIEEIWLNDLRVTLDGSGVVTNGKYPDGCVSIETRLGSVPGLPYAGLIADFPSLWTAAHRLDGLASALCRFRTVPADKFSDVYGGGEPEYNQVSRWQRPRDPRTGVEVWTDNAACVIGWYLTSAAHGMGRRITWADLDLPSWAQAAADCDDPIPLRAGGTEPRWRLGGSYQLTERGVDVLARLLAACDGEIFMTAAGKIGLRVGKYRPPQFELTGWDHVLAVRSASPTPDAADLWTVGQAVYVEPRLDYLETTADEWRAEARIALYGERIRDFQFFMCQSHGQTRRLLKVRQAKENPPLTLTLVTDLYGMAAVGAETILLRLPDLGIDGVFRFVSPPELSEDLTSVTMQLAAFDAAAVYGWAAATEEGDGPEIPARTDPALGSAHIPAPVLTATVERGLLNGSTPAAQIRLGWPEPPLGQVAQAQYARAGTEVWETILTVEGQLSALTPWLPDNASYDLRARYVGPRGSGAWATVSGVEIQADATPPAPPGVSDVVMAGGALVLRFAPDWGARYAVTELWRAGPGAAFASAARIASAPSPLAEICDPTPPASADYWLISLNHSGVASAPVFAHARRP